MSSTDDSRERELLETFYRDRIVPTANALQARGVTLLPDGPEAGKESYWVPRDSPADYITTFSDADLQSGSERLWASRPELKALAADIASLASRLEATEDEWSDVSPYIYAMF